jgi:hypothetical protein
MAEELLKATCALLPGQPFTKGAQYTPLEGLLRWLLQSRKDMLGKQAAAMTITKAECEARSGLMRSLLGEGAQGCPPLVQSE